MIFILVRILREPHKNEEQLRRAPEITVMSLPIASFRPPPSVSSSALHPIFSMQTIENIRKFKRYGGRDAPPNPSHPQNIGFLKIDQLLIKYIPLGKAEARMRRFYRNLHIGF